MWLTILLLVVASTVSSIGVLNWIQWVVELSAANRRRKALKKFAVAAAIVGGLLALHYLKKKGF